MHRFEEMLRAERDLCHGSRRLIFLIAAAFALSIAALFCRRSSGEQLPPQPAPLGVAASDQEIELGRFMFYNKLLSADGTVSCASCHDPRKGWGDGLPLAVGIGNQVGTRNSPTLINVSWVPLVFWDGRTVSTTAQALLPISNPIEMGRQTEQQAVARLNLDPATVERFVKVFGIDQTSGRAVTGIRLARALAAFQTEIVSANAPVDRYRDGDKSALSPDARIGYEIFDKSGCMKCHVPPLYTNNTFINNGSEFAGKSRVTDQGRFSVPSSGRTPNTVRAFKVPTLREITRTGPYMHAGQFDSLERVVAHYNAGGANYQGVRDRSIDQRIKPLGLTETQADYLVTFLKEGFTGRVYPMIEAP